MSRQATQDSPSKTVAVVTQGHPFDAPAFYAIFDDMPGVEWRKAEHPEAESIFLPGAAERFDAMVMYDMPGIRFRPSAAPEFVMPSAELVAGFSQLFEQGQGFVFLHHAIAAWPAWPDYGEIVGGRFLYQPAVLRGTPCQDSGYRHHVTHTISCTKSHPVLAGIPERFPITDELYLYEVFEDEVEPLLVSDYRFEQDNFYSADLAVREGRMNENQGWQHGPGSSLVGWCKTYRNSRIVYLQCGDDAQAYTNPHYRRLIANAIDWVS